MARGGRPAKRKAALSDDEQSDYERPALSGYKSLSGEDDFASGDETPINGGAFKAAGDDEDDDEAGDDEEQGSMEEDEYAPPQAQSASSRVAADGWQIYRRGHQKAHD